METVKATEAEHKTTEAEHKATEAEQKGKCISDLEHQNSEHNLSGHAIASEPKASGSASSERPASLVSKMETVKATEAEQKDLEHQNSEHNLSGHAIASEPKASGSASSERPASELNPSSSLTMPELSDYGDTGYINWVAYHQSTFASSQTPSYYASDDVTARELNDGSLTAGISVVNNGSTPKSPKDEYIDIFDLFNHHV